MGDDNTSSTSHRSSAFTSKSFETTSFASVEIFAPGLAVELPLALLYEANMASDASPMGSKG